MARLFLVTANVGSIFENLEKGLSIWLNEFALAVRSRDPEFVAIHFQETGGKDCSDTTDSVEAFYRQLIGRMEQLNFRVAEGFVDTSSNQKDQFTALSSIYFVYESLRLPVHIWDFQDAKFHPISLTSSSATSSHLPNVHLGPALDQTYRKQKEKFPQHFYPNCKWSRKGFLRTRWRIGTTVLDLVNIHLFHDSCNLMAASAFPSPFAQHREKTLKYTLDRIQSDGLSKCPLFIFGDFNFRINAFGVMDILRKDFDGAGEAESEIIFATKRFHCPEQELRFKQSFEWLKQHDFELKKFPGLLQEYDLNFHPTYPFDEDVDSPEKFMKTRLPAWCDRVLFTPSTANIISKPVSLLLKITTDEHPPTSTMNCNTESNPTLANESPLKGKSKELMMLMMMTTGTTNGNEISGEEVAKFSTTSPTLLPLPETDANASFHDEVDDSYSPHSVDKTPARSVLDSDAKLNRVDGGSGDGVGESKDIMKSSSSYSLASNDKLRPFQPVGKKEDGKSPIAAAGCKCFNGLFRFRGKVRLGAGGGGGGGSKNKSYFGFKSFSKFRKGGGVGGGSGRSGSMLEPIAFAAYDPPVSSLPSSGIPSQRPSIMEVGDLTLNDDKPPEPNLVECLVSSKNVDFFTVPAVPNGTAKLEGGGEDYHWKCGSYCGVIPIKDSPCPKSDVQGCPNENCASRLMQMITNSRNNGSSEIIPIGSSNLSLIALNSDMEKKGDLGPRMDCGGDGKIPMSWSSSPYTNCTECCLNNKNLQNNHLYNNPHHQEKSQPHSANGLSAFSCRGRSASQGSATVQTYKTHLKEGMSKTSAAAGDCISCSKCVIL